jgi:hypothetical protein
LEVGAEGGFKLDLRQDPDPGKQELKGAVRTETYWRHYCQHKQCLLTHESALFPLTPPECASKRNKKLNNFWWVVYFSLCFTYYFMNFVNSVNMNGIVEMRKTALG